MVIHTNPEPTLQKVIQCLHDAKQSATLIILQLKIYFPITSRPHEALSVSQIYKISRPKQRKQRATKIGQTFPKAPFEPRWASHVGDGGVFRPDLALRLSSAPIADYK